MTTSAPTSSRPLRSWSLSMARSIRRRASRGPVPTRSASRSSCRSTANRVTRRVPGVETHARSRGLIESDDRARRGAELASGGVLGVYPTRWRVPHFEPLLARSSTLHRRRCATAIRRCPGRSLTRSRDVRPGAGVHLQEEERAVLVEELHGSRVHVAAGTRDLDGRFAHGATHVIRKFGAGDSSISF